MRIGQAYPSKYLKASDIPDGQFVPVTIDRVECEDVSGGDGEGETKPVIYFAGKTKGMVLNKTNANVIAGVYGDETDDWTGKKILLYQTEVEFGGKMVPALRVKVKKGGATNGAAAPVPKITRTAERQ